MKRPANGLCLLLVSVASLGIAGCTSDGPAPDATETSPLRVMQFNIEYGGTVVDFDSVPAAIDAADADVVAVQEGYASMPKLARALGWKYYDSRTQTVSRYPLITPVDPSDPQVLVAVEPGRTVAVINVHLPSAPYGPNRAAAGASAEELIAAEKGRLKAIQPALDAVDRLQREGTPVILTGDFNAPSNLDWTSATDGQRDQVIPVEWPVSIAVQDTGLTDVYRTVYPDPVVDEGLTWPASRPRAGTYNPGPGGKPADRVDQMYVSEGIEVSSAEIVGELSSADTDISVKPWPSDHRAMVAELEVPLVEAAPYVAAEQRLVEQGTDVKVFAFADPAPQSVTVTGLDFEERVSIGGVGSSGSVIVNTSSLAPGTYEVAAKRSDGTTVATSQLWVRAVGAEPKVATGSSAYRVGEPIDVTWQNAPANKWDWLGIYKRGADPNVAYYKLWTYTEATVEGAATLDDSVSGGPWPLPPGKYDVLLLADDSYVELARTGFVVARAEEG
ncbi:MAG: endonuclease/exonuclease/phosphatase family protein [Actinomycetia bacterium]|nr:endonuclease/exonuclease/phosphatase family protein [Actinomycetes bacterium]